ncbi:MAG: Extracellular solute-binding protein [Candidatus Magasanikbacteria bacterium GW2011_GWA2_37_8]|uniref:Extracellular solute-binding protein n=1 Tax=Candidatus Magasanikbacteria bacterium GW2011_GWA2_37_8 TaxID=1619036 RepID=A0A0G0JTA1_9BACT|nr:MAG: Extracellular solute-binding protein [Candidatus Magasanikbacteria bacterium GW2011_GWA2_37_8]
MQKKFKLTAIFVLLLSLVTTMGFGCKGLSTTEQQATKAVTLEYWTVFDDVDALRAQIAKYKADRPYITVNVRQLRADEIYQRLIEALAEDRGPDIISINNRELRAYQSKLAPMPVSVNDTLVRYEKTTLSGVNTIITPQVRSMVDLAGLDREYVKVIKNDVVLDGRIFGLPLSLDTMAVFYNKDLADRAGIAEPPKNWDEFQSAVKKITKYDKKTGKIIQSGTALGTGNNIPNSDDLLYILFKQSNVGFVGNSGQAVFNYTPANMDRGADSPAMSVLNFYTDFANSSRDTYAWDESMDSALERFVNGSVGFFFGYSYHLPVIKARAPQLNLGVLPLFQLNPEQPVNVANYWVQAVVAKSTKQNEAWGLIDYLAHSGSVKEYLDVTGRPTAVRAYINSQKENLELSPFVSQLLVADNWYRGRDYSGATRAIDDMLHEWLQPIPNPDQAGLWKQNILNRAASRVNQTL